MSPAGKRDDVSLREKVKEIQRDLSYGIDTIGKKMSSEVTTKRILRFCVMKYMRWITEMR
jgi:hypothetical protein